MGVYIVVVVHGVGAWGTVHGLSAGRIVVTVRGLQGGVVLGVVVWGGRGLVVEGEPVHDVEGAGGRAGVEGCVLGRIVEVGEGGGLGRMEKH